MKIDYEIYKDMTPAQKEEWDYEYNKEYKNFVSLSDVILLYVLNSFLLMSAYFLIEVKGLEEVREQVLSNINLSASFTVVYLTLLVVLQILYFISGFIDEHNAKKWLELNNINYKRKRRFKWD